MFEGNELANSDVNEVLKKGISMIHQEMLVTPEFTVAQNIFLQDKSTRWLPNWLNDSDMEKKKQKSYYPKWG